jgi:predicted XRE-type DNA-binding protein
MKMTRSSGNVFTDLGFDKETAENLRLRADLMIELREVIQRKGLTQAQAAKLFGVSQPRISDLVRGKISLFTIDMLVNMLARAGKKVVLQTKRMKAARHKEYLMTIGDTPRLG